MFSIQPRYQNYLLLYPCAISVCAYRWCMVTSLSMSHATTNKPRLYHEYITNIPDKNLGTLLGTCSEMSNNTLSLRLEVRGTAWIYLGRLNNKFNLGILRGKYSY